LIRLVATLDRAADPSAADQYRSKVVEMLPATTVCGGRAGIIGHGRFA